MSEFFKKRVIFPIIGAIAFVFSLVWALVSTPKTYAATEQLLYQLTLSDIIANTNNLSSTPQGSKGVWYWKGIKSLDTNSLEFKGDGDYIYFWFGIDENSTDENLKRVTRLEWSFTASKAGGVMILCGDYSNLNQSINNGENNISLNGFVSKYNYFKFDIHVGGTSTPSTLTAFDIKLYYTPGAAATITKGTGIDSVYLSNSSSATSGSNSGTSFDDGSTVYGFAKLKAGYKHPSNDWTLISGTADTENAIYRIGSRTINGAAVDFGTINATPKTKTINLNSNGGVGSGSVDLTYDQAAQAPSTGISRELFEFDGWNTRADGSGWDLTTELSKWDVNDLILNNSIDIYAKWKINADGVKTLINNIGAIECTEESKSRIKDARDGYDSLNDDGKAAVDNYNLLEAAEGIFAYLLVKHGEAQIGNKIYPTIVGAVNEITQGETIVLRKDVDLSDEHIEITKSFTIDLNGHTLKTTMEDGTTGTPTLLVTTDDTVISIKNSMPETGGVDGTCIIDSNTVDSYVKLYDCRLTISKEIITEYLSDANIIAPGYEILNINFDGSPDQNGFVSIVRPKSVFDISNLTEDYIIPDGQTLVGTLQNAVKISIPDGATITLKGVNINGNGAIDGAGITCLGDANIMILGYNEVTGYNNGAGIFIPEGHTLTIDGDGYLYAQGGNNSAGIGGNANTNNGNIVINDGIIDARAGGSYAAPIGSGYSNYNDIESGNITINGGVISASSNYAAAIGSGCGEGVGDIVINGGYIEAFSHDGGAGIGAGKDGHCDSILIEGSVAKVRAYAEDSNSQKIGAGSNGTCDSITISTALTQKPEGNSLILSHDKLLIIGGTLVTGNTTSGEGWSYDKDTNTLTLDGFEFEGKASIYNNYLGNGYAFGSVINYDGEEKLIINIVGENTIINTSDYSDMNLCGIHSVGQIEFTGNGTLYVSFTGESNLSTIAISSGSTMTIDGPTIVATGGKASYTSEGIHVHGNGLNIVSGTVVAMAASNCNYSHGIDSNGSEITIGEIVRSLVVSGYKSAFSYETGVINYIRGTGWTDVLATEGETAIETSTTGRPIDGFKYINLIGITPEDVITLINNIGDVEYTSSCKEKIDTARDAYDFLKQEEQAKVTNYDKLVAAEAMYNHVDDTFKKINAIGDVEYTSESKALIDAARSAYDALTDGEEALLPNYSTLTSAETMYNHVDDSTVKIDAIGEVKYKEESKALIDTARSAYNALTEAEKGILLNYDKLTLAESTYNTLENQAVANVKNLIDAIGDVEYKEESKAKIDAARSAYDALNNNSKELVDNINTLLAAEELYNTVLNVIEKINDALNPNYDTASKTKIDTARNAYNALTPLEKALVVNYESLTKTEDDYAKVDAVVKEIDALGAITYDTESDNKIKSARANVEDLTEDQKAFLPEAKSDTLEDYETTYVVLEKIYSMNSVKYSTESEAQIEEVREAYESLSDEQKALINANDLKKLTSKEKAYSKLKSGANAWVVILIIFAINIITAGGLFAFMLLRDVEFKKNTKAMSVAIPLPLIILVSHYADPAYVVFYVFLGIGALVWLAVLAIFLLKKNGIFFVEKNKASKKSLDEKEKTTAVTVAKPMAIVEVKEEKAKKEAKPEVKEETNTEVKEEPKEETKKSRSKKAKKEVKPEEETKPEVEEKAEPEAETKLEEAPVDAAAEAKPMVEETKAEEATETAPEAEEAEEEEVETLTDESGNTFKIQYVSSFTAKLIQASDEVKNQYNELKKEILAYKGTKAKITWHYETISIKKNVLLRFGIRGKTLYLYFALDYAEYENSKYKLENVTSKKHQQAPCLYKIKNDRRFNYAKELIEILLKKFELEKGELPTENYILPYEDKDALVEKGLIKKLETKIN